jgi:hypothetical protein
MIEANVIRPIVPFDTRLLLQEDLTRAFVIEWPHLSVTYQILMQLLTKVPHFPHHPAFAQKLIPVCDSPDPNERASITTFYGQASRLLPGGRDFLVAAFSGYLQLHAIGTDRCPFLISTLLTVLENIQNQGAPILDADRLFLTVILPLLRHPYLCIFGEPMAQAICRVQASSPLNALEAVGYLLAKWPRNCPPKQVFFVNYLVAALSRVRSLEPLVPKLKEVFEEIGESASTKVVDAFLAGFLKPSGDRVLTVHGNTLIQIMKAPLVELAANHWEPEMRTSARTLLILARRKEGRAIRTGVQQELTAEIPEGLAKWTDIINLGAGTEPRFDKGALWGQVSQLYAPKPVVEEPPVLTVGSGRVLSGKQLVTTPQICHPQLSVSAVSNILRK